VVSRIKGLPSPRGGEFLLSVFKHFPPGLCRILFLGQRREQKVGEGYRHRFLFSVVLGFVVAE